MSSRRSVGLAASLLVVWAQSAAAQPADPAPHPGAGPRDPAAPAAAAAQLEPLTLEEWNLLAEGEISGAAHVGGGLAAVFLGLGTGPLMQGRYLERGWIFTVGQLAGGMMATIGAPSCPDGSCGLAYAGIATFAGFRIWEVVDTMVVPNRHNQRVRSVRFRYQQGAPPPPELTGYVVPATRGDGALAGLRFSF